ncbi:MAG TPA: hypothetical protein VGP07_00530 [Polyangia bacterium]
MTSVLRMTVSARHPGNPWTLPLARGGLAVVAQSVVSLGFAHAGFPQPWRQAAGWWVAWLVPLNLATIALLGYATGRDGMRLGNLFEPLSVRPRQDLPWYLFALIVSLPLGLLPNLVLARVLWGPLMSGAAPIFHAMPMALVWVLLVLVPVTQSLAEPPLYLGLSLPRLLASGRSRPRAILLCAAAMSLQNVFLPLLFNWRFALWRGAMFFPLTLWLTAMVARRPTLLPYLGIAHGAMNVSLVLLVMRVSMPIG